MLKTYHKLLRSFLLAGLTIWVLPGRTANTNGLAEGPFEPTWESLAQYQIPAWFADAKFGIWAHWGPQSAPGNGDWYARNLYLQGNSVYDFHLLHYGHPSEFGFKDIIPLWHAENFDPDALVALYKEAGWEVAQDLSESSEKGRVLSESDPLVAVMYAAFLKKIKV